LIDDRIGECEGFSQEDANEGKIDDFTITMHLILILYVEYYDINLQFLDAVSIALSKRNTNYILSISSF